MIRSLVVTIFLALVVASTAAADTRYCFGDGYGNDNDNTCFGHDHTDLAFGMLKGNDTFYGEGGNDSAHGNADNDTLFGNKGDDELIGGGGTDYLSGGYGNDRIDAATGDPWGPRDTIHCGPGFDIVKANARDFIMNPELCESITIVPDA